MKSISASVIVVAGTALILGGSGSYIGHGDTKLFVQAVGCIVCAIGLWGWFQTIKEK